MKRILVVVLLSLCAVAALAATPSYQPVNVFLPGMFWQFSHVTTILSSSTAVLDNDGDSLAFVFQAPQDMVITGGCIRLSSITSDDDIKVRIETVGADGNPTTTLADEEDTTTFDPTALSNNEFTFVDGDTVAAGDVLALVFHRLSGGTANVALQTSWINGSVLYSAYPYVNFKGSAGSYTRDDLVPNFGIKGTTLAGAALGYVFHGGTAADSARSVSYDSTSNPDEYAVRFKPSVPMEVTGVASDMTILDASPSFRWALYSGDTTTVADVVVSHTNMSATLDGSAVYFFDECPCTLSANTWYRLGQMSIDAENIQWFDMKHTDTLQLGTYPAPTAKNWDWYGSSRWTYYDGNIDAAGAWVNDSLRRPMQVSLIVTKLSAGLEGGDFGRRRKIMQTPMGWLRKESTNEFAGAHNAELER